MSFNNTITDSIRKTSPKEDLGPSGKLLQPKNKNVVINEPIVIPSAVNMNNVKKLSRNSQQVSSSNNMQTPNNFAQNDNSYSNMQNNNLYGNTQGQVNTNINSIQQPVQPIQPVQPTQPVQPVQQVQPTQPLQQAMPMYNQQVEQAEVRRRGRPKKVSNIEDINNNEEIEKPKRRGRPKKDDFDATLSGFGTEQDSVLPGFGTEQDPTLPGFGAEQDSVLPGFGTEKDSTLPGFVSEQDSTLPGFGSEQDSTLPGFGTEQDSTLPGFGTEQDSTLPGFGTEQDSTLPGFGTEQDSTLSEFGTEQDSTLSGFGTEQDSTLSGFGSTQNSTMSGFGTEQNSGLPEYQTQQATNTFNSMPNGELNNNATANTQFTTNDLYNNKITDINQNSNNNMYSNSNQNSNAFADNNAYTNNNNTYGEYTNGYSNPNIGNSNISSSNNADISRLLTDGKKIVTFVGTSKNGTSFILNNLAEYASSMGINVAILDTTKNKNSYYIYTKNEEDLRKIAAESLQNLIQGQAKGISVNRYLTVYTSLPSDREELESVNNILETLVRNHNLILIDCDFDTPIGYFSNSQEIYLVQSLDVLTIQPLTAFLRELKAKNVLDQNKLKIILNKYVKVRGISEKTIIGGMAFYNDPAMSFMTELFDRNTVNYISIPFEEEIYTRYLESVINCDISIKGYSKTFMQVLKELNNMVYPMLPGNNSYRPPVSSYNNAFSPNMNNTLNQMKNKY